MKRITRLAIALIAATLTGCNLDFIAGRDIRDCPWAADSTWHPFTNTHGALDSALVIVQMRACE